MPAGGASRRANPTAWSAGAIALEPRPVSRPSAIDGLRFVEAITFGTLVLVIAGIVGALAPDASASAASTATAALALSPASGAPGSVVTATGTGYGHDLVQLLWDQAADGMPQIQASGNGTFSTTFRVPSGVSVGTHSVSATSGSTTTSPNRNGRAPGGKTSGGSSSAAFSVLLTTASTASPVASTTPTLTPKVTATPTVSTPAPSNILTPAPTSTPTATVVKVSPTPTATSVATPTAAPASATATPRPSATASPAPSPTAAPPSASPAPTLATGFVSHCGTTLCVNGAEWYLYGAAGRDVATAQAAHLNTVRITNWLHEEPGNDPYQESRWVIVDTVLAQAAAARMHAILDLSTYRNFLFNSGLNPYTQDWSTFISFVAKRVNTINGVAYRDDPTIALVAFAGEVDGIKGNTDPRSPTTAQLNAFFQRSFTEWRALDGHHLLQPGGLLHYSWDSGIDWQTIFSYADVCSIHNYSSDDTAATPTVAAYCASIGKPWITEEFGWSQTIGDATRAEKFNGMYALQRANHAAGVAVWYFGPQLTGVNGVVDTYDVNSATALTWGAVVASAP